MSLEDDNNKPEKIITDAYGIKPRYLDYLKKYESWDLKWLTRYDSSGVIANTVYYWAYETEKFDKYEDEDRPWFQAYFVFKNIRTEIFRIPMFRKSFSNSYSLDVFINKVRQFWEDFFDFTPSTESAQAISDWTENRKGFQNSFIKVIAGGVVFRNFVYETRFESTVLVHQFAFVTKQYKIEYLNEVNIRATNDPEEDIKNIRIGITNLYDSRCVE
jgi:hypothetical protein